MRPGTLFLFEIALYCRERGSESFRVTFQWMRAPRRADQRDYVRAAESSRRRRADSERVGPSHELSLWQW